jgi:hypothetical protein
MGSKLLGRNAVGKHDQCAASGSVFALEWDLKI